MLKNLKKAAAIVLSFAMAVQFGLADSYYVNAVEEPVEPQQEETKTTTTTPQEQEKVPTTEEETPQQQEEQQQPAVEEEQPAAEEAQPQPQPVEQAEVKVSYVKEDDTDLMESVTATYDVGYRLDQDANVFKEAHEAFEFEYAFVNGNKENKITKDQVKASGLTVTSDMTSLTLVYKEKASTEKPKKANKQETAKTETTSESDDASDADTKAAETQLQEFYITSAKSLITKGESVQLTAHFRPSDYANKNVTWKSENPDVATVDETGKVTSITEGTVTIKATAQGNADFTDTITITVDPIKVTSIEITGNTAEYLLPGNTVQLSATSKPDNADDKTIVWESVTPEVATVDQNGLVKAVKQGTTIIRAKNEVSGAFSEVRITVYNNKPVVVTVNVWVTNQNQNKSYTFNIPQDGTEVTPSQVARDTNNGQRDLVTSAEFRVGNFGSNANWSDIQKNKKVAAFRYKSGVQYKLEGETSWNTLGSKKIYDFCGIKYTASGNQVADTDVKVTIGDWPYGKGENTNWTNNTITIKVLNKDENNDEVYNSGLLRFSKYQTAELGKINFNCNESKYKVTTVTVVKNGKESTKVTYNEGNIPADLSVQFNGSSQNSNYVVTAYITAKTINVKYVSDGETTNMPKDTTTKTTGNVTVDETIPVREGYIFTGWAYSDGNATTLYQGGATFVAPIHDVELKAQWVKTSEQINYKVNDAKMGSVSRTYERVQAGKTAKGSIARANSGYVFVNWTDEENNVVSTDSSYIPEKTDPATYTANFKAKKSSLIIHYTDDKGNKIREDDTEQIAFGKEWSVDAPEIKGYKQPSEKTQSGTKKDETEEITFFYTQKEGKVVYNLGPKGSWGNGSPENVVVFDAAKGKWAYNYGFDKGDTFVVTDSVPTSSDNAVFVGWYDKERGTTPAAMRTAGEKVTYPYTESSKTNTYTLDALWEKLQGTNQELPYDGKKHSLDKFTVKFANDNLQGWTDSASSLVQASNIQYRLKQNGKEVNEWGAMPSFKDAGTYTIVAKATVNGVELTAEATLTINRKKYTVETLDGNKTYDGIPLTAGAKINGIIEGEVVEIKTTKSLTDVGSIPNDKYELTWETAKATNYKLVGEKFGTLTVTVQSIDPGTDPEKPNPDYTGAKVNSPSDKVYDGKEHKWSPTVTDKADKKLEAGTDYTVEYSTSDFTNVGTIKVTITGKGNYTGTVTRTYKITPKSVTVTAEDKTKVFGETDPELMAKVAGTLGKDTVDYTLSREAGEAAGKYTITPSGKAEQGNYSVTYATGTLTITSQSIDPGTDPENPNPDYTGAKVNSPSDAVYDGNEHKWIPTVTDKADKKLKAGTDYTVEYSTKNFKDVGTVEVTITGKGNYTGTVTRTYKITPKSVTVAANDKTKVFGETDPKLTATVAGTLGNDTVDYKLSRKDGEAVGKYAITASGKAEQGNYTVTYATGTLTITSQSIDPGTDPEKPNPDYTGAKVNSPKDSVYDGKEHKWSPTVTDKTKTLELGKDYTVEYSTSDFTNVGTIEVVITGIGNYSGTVKRSYKVTPREYTVTTESATKTYSGTALTAGGKVEGIVSGETVEFTTTGSQTEVGTSKNTYELVWKSAKATNYTLAKESIGELTVKAKSIVPDDKDTPESEKTGITVNEPSDSKYDGKEHREVLTVTDTKTGKELVAGTDYSVTYSSDLVNAGTVKVTVAGLGNYTGSFTKTYKITKRSVTLTSATVSKVYDGSALTNTSITVSGDGFVEGEGATYSVTGTQTEVGNSANAFEYKLNENTLASNYNITKVVGTLTITAAPAPVTPATPSTPSSTTSTTPRTPSAPQVTTPVETVEKETTPKAEPKKEEKVEEEYTPKASPQYYWALINLICAILTVLFGLLLLISKRHKDEDDDEEDDETKQQTNNDDEENEQEKKRGLFTRVLAVLIAIVSVVFFLVTEDLSLPWTWTDQWTIWMVVIGLVQIVVFFVGRKWKNVDNDDEDEEAQQA